MQIAEEIARASGIEQLSDRHWQVVNFMRNAYLQSGSAPLFKLSSEDFIPQVRDIITVGEFYGLAGGGQIIFT